MAHYLISGVSGGIGRAVTAGLLAGGHVVSGIARNPDRVVDAGLAEVIVADLAHPENLEAALSDFLADRYSLDGIIHCAGIVRAGPLSDTAVADFTDQFAVNVTAAAELIRLCLPALQASRGTVVLVNSGSGLNVRAPLAAYGMSKYALRAYADALRAEQPLLRVSTVYPGRTATAMQRVVRAAETQDYRAADYIQPGTVAGVICSLLALAADAVVTDVTIRPVSTPVRSSPDAP